MCLLFHSRLPFCLFVSVYVELNLETIRSQYRVFEGMYQGLKHISRVKILKKCPKAQDLVEKR